MYALKPMCARCDHADAGCRIALGTDSLEKARAEFLDQRLFAIDEDLEKFEKFCSSEVVSTHGGSREMEVGRAKLSAVQMHVCTEVRTVVTMLIARSSASRTVARFPFHDLTIYLALSSDSSMRCTAPPHPPHLPYPHRCK